MFDLTKRLIPAHAGKTVVTLPMGRASPAHPRSRGENQSAPRSNRSDRGSSPLTRGKRRRPERQRRQAGLIPAHAGKTGESGCKTVIARAHPRSRGENKALDTDAHPTQGSSPLTRGKLTGPDNLCSFVRLIPAHAGKTRSRICSESAPAAHPRSRGENMPTQKAMDMGLGSSPLTRGKRAQSRASGLWRRLIPAHAGKTASPRRALLSVAAHPRSRGENRPWTPIRARSWGSSPLTRGKLMISVLSVCRGGLIPAHAGKTGQQ